MNAKRKLSQSAWVDMTEEHWKEHRPKMYQELKEAGILEETVSDAVVRTTNEMSSMMGKGATRDEAWQTLRERYMILPPEQSEFEED